MSTAPISPPVTPKAFAQELYSPTSELQLPPLIGRLSIPSSPPPTDLRRKSNARRYSRTMSTADKDTITFRDPFSTTELKYHRRKSIPKRSPSPSTRGSFTMDVFEDLNNGGGAAGGMSRKRRNQSEERMTEASVTRNQPSFSALLSTERHVKKAKTDAAAAYDRVDITQSDEAIFQDPEWIPDMDAFSTLPAVKVVWKGSPLAIDGMPYYECLHPGEVNIASTLRLTPEQYLKCRRSLILAAQEFDKLHIPFRKSDAQKCVRIDVNKTSTLWSVFSKLGWLNPRSSSSTAVSVSSSP